MPALCCNNVSERFTIWKNGSLVGIGNDTKPLSTNEDEIWKTGTQVLPSHMWTWVCCKWKAAPTISNHSFSKDHCIKHSIPFIILGKTFPVISQSKLMILRRTIILLLYNQTQSLTILINPLTEDFNSAKDFSLFRSAQTGTVAALR